VKAGTGRRWDPQGWGRPSEEAADAKRGVGEHKLDRFVRGRRVGHQRGACQNARLMQFNDGTVDAGGKSEIVSVDYEAGHEAKSINSRPCTRKEVVRPRPLLE
jgi:hypothetical protein